MTIGSRSTLPPSTRLPWHWRQLPLRHRSGRQVFQQLVDPAVLTGADPSPAAIAVLLESPDQISADANAAISTLARYSLCAGAPRRQEDQLHLWTPPVGDILPTLRSHCLTRDTAVDPAIAHLPFTGGWLGWLGYDLAQEIEQLPHICPEELPFPPAFWYEPDWFAVLDHHAQALWLAVTDPADLDRYQHRLEQSIAPYLALSEVIPTESLRADLPAIQFGQTQAQYEAAVRQAKAHILAGDIFQANLSLRFTTTTPQTGWQLYQQLQQINPSPFASYWHTPWGDVVSCSPERLVQCRDRQVQTRPIAGTRPRGAQPSADQRYAQELLDNRKENAEHIMLVDLERNDLGRVCRWGSVKVDELLTIERYSHVMHLVSNVVGELRRDRDWVDLIAAVFPGGTITGCPKVRCMEIIEALEPVRRSLFYGSCGYVDQRGHLDLNILIRTLLVTPSPPTIPSPSAPPLYHVYGQVGAGIVADSDPTQEWHESLQKAQAQLLAIQRATQAARAEHPT